MKCPNPSAHRGGGSMKKKGGMRKKGIFQKGEQRPGLKDKEHDERMS